MANRDIAHGIAGQFGLYHGYTPGALAWLEARITTALDAAELQGKKAAAAELTAAPPAEKGTRSEQNPGRVASTGLEPLAPEGPTCLGSYVLKSACKACFRCNQEKSMLLRNYRLGYWTRGEIESFGITPPHGS